MKISDDMYASFLVWSEDSDNEELHQVMFDLIVDKVGDDAIDIGRVIVEMTRVKLAEEREEEI